MRVLIAPDKFKGTLTARQAADAIACGWRRICPRDELVRLPISDGGDGFGLVLAGLRRARPVRTATVDAAGRRCLAQWWWNAAERTAIIESARVIGLAQLPPGKFQPFNLDTRGLAALLQAAAKRGVRRCLIGIGGSATNDAGFGLAQGLGWQFLNKNGTPLKHWRELNQLARVLQPSARRWPKELIVAVDVQNKLLGAKGCTRVYGPQKGLRSQDFSEAEAGLRQLARVMRQTLGRDVAATPGAGAAGGLGFGLVAFAGATMTPGFELVAQEAGLAKQLRRADLVITGEGRIDRSTLMGKGVGELAALCRKADVPCVALGGAIENRLTLAGKFAFAGALTDLTSPTRARAEAKVWLEKLASQAAQHLTTPLFKLV